MKVAPQIMPPEWDKADAAALQALQDGTATEHQQKRALDWIIRKAAATYDLSFSPEGERLTSFAEGRRFVGLQVVKLLAINLPALKKE